jgi:endo-alpha-1,4-polygalactosaminidase (GH114 family)
MPDENVIPFARRQKPARAPDLHLEDVSVPEAREALIRYVTDRWQTSLIALAHKLTQQGFAQGEILDLCDGYRPMFEENLTKALEQFDENAATFKAACGRLDRA